MPFWVYVLFIIGIWALVAYVSLDEKKHGYVYGATLGFAGFLGICSGLAILGNMLGLQ